MIKELIKLANDLDEKGFHKEADYLDWIIKNANSNLKNKYYFGTQIQTETPLVFRENFLSIMMQNFKSNLNKMLGHKEIDNPDVKHYKPNLRMLYERDGSTTYDFKVELHSNLDLIKLFGSKFEQPAVEIVNSLLNKECLGNYKKFTREYGSSNIFPKNSGITKIIGPEEILNQVKEIDEGGLK